MTWLFLLHGTLVPTSVTSVIPIITLRELSWFDPNNDCYLGPRASWEVKPAYGSIVLLTLNLVVGQDETMPLD